MTAQLFSHESCPRKWRNNRFRISLVEVTFRLTYPMVLVAAFSTAAGLVQRSRNARGMATFGNLLIASTAEIGKAQIRHGLDHRTLGSEAASQTAYGSAPKSLIDADLAPSLNVPGEALPSSQQQRAGSDSSRCSGPVTPCKAPCTPWMAV